MSKKKRKGFTLIELLAVLLLLSLCAVIGIYFSTSALEQTKNKTESINLESLYKSAIMYTDEYKNSDDWIAEWNTENNDVTGDEFVCVAVDDLVAKGYVRSDKVPENYQDKYVMLRRDSTTKSYKKLEKTQDFLSDNSSCNSYDSSIPVVQIKVNNEKNIWQKDNITGTIEYTVGSSSIKETNYYYIVDGKKFPIEANLQSGNLITTSFDIAENGENIRICGQITNKLGRKSKLVCEGIYKKDDVQPELKINIQNDQIKWYKEVLGNFEVTTGKSGIKESNYYLINNETKTPIEVSEKNEFNITTSGKNMKVCGQLTGGNGISSGEVCSENFSIDVEKPYLVTKGNLNKGSFNNPVYKDNLSENITIYTCISTSKNITKTDSCFSSIATSRYSSVCGTTYYLYTYAVDEALNESDIELNDSYSYNCSSSSGNKNSSSTSSSNCDTTCQMKKNSEAYNNTTDAAEKEKLHAENEKLAQENSACKNGCSYNSSTGVWTDSNGDKLYDVSNTPKNSSSSSKSSSSSSRSNKSSSSTATKIVKTVTNVVKKIIGK